MQKLPRALRNVGGIAAVVLLAAGLGVFSCSGCGGPPSGLNPQQIATLRAQILLDEEPAGALAVLDLREEFTGVVHDPEDAHPDHQHGDASHSDPSRGDEGDARVEVTSDVEPPAVEAASVPKDDPAGRSLEGDARREAVVVGIIGGMPNPYQETEPDFPWRRGQATLFLVDPATASEFADHADSHAADGADCAFCARRAARSVDSVAVVNLVDEAGQVVPVGAESLMGVAENDMVVLKGTARMVGGNLLVIDARNLYVRR